ncbi:MAG: ABC transporter substrate-binding protein, partial [Alphaproteobacteria bacterium]
MVEVPITIACGNYDRTRAIRDGRVKVEGCEVTYLPLYPEEIFFRAFRYQEFDVSELSFSSYIRTVAAGNSAYVGIPAFVSRLFRHSCIYVRTDAGIRAPADLKGKRIGLPEYQITAVVWMRGMLQHEYGVLPTEIH